MANGAPAAEEAAEQDPYAFLPKPADNSKVSTWRSRHAFSAMYPIVRNLAATQVWKHLRDSCMGPLMLAQLRARHQELVGDRVMFRL